MTTTRSSTRSPLRLTGHLEGDLSRWLWLLKMVLALPHLVLLAFLWVAFVAVTVVAGVAVLVTGRYPRPLFDFTVGVLRWSWRVGFYAWAALGTDRYPPFTLASTDYPADLQVDYPERLSRGLVLVKPWLLALPHLLVVALLAGDVLTYPWAATAGWSAADAQPVGAYSVLNLLVVLAGVVLLLTGRYPRGLFDLVMGVDRWLYRVLAYVALMTDEYPPFRLDEGPEEPLQERPRHVPAQLAGSVGR